jgi:hypothetical protein
LFSSVASEGTDFIRVTLVDSSGNVIKTLSSSNPLSIVQGTPGVSGMYLTVTATNTGTVPLSCSLITVTPTAFDTAMNKAMKYVPSTSPKKASWTSSLISVAQFEPLSQPVVFSVTARCSYMQGSNTVYLTDKTGSVSLNIQPDATGAGFEVSMDTGGLGTEWCGDGICQSNEDATSCAPDCTVTANAKFRTLDVGYASGGAIAYNSGTCGLALTSYGYFSSSGLLTGVCSTASKTYCGTSPVLTLSNLPGGWKSGGASVSLWKPTETGTMCLCDDDGTKYVLQKYTTADSDASKMTLANGELSGISFDSLREVSCV